MICAINVQMRREPGGEGVKRRRKLFVKERSGERKT